MFIVTACQIKNYRDRENVFFSVVFKEKKLLTPFLEPLGHSRGESNNFKLDMCLYKTFPCRKGEKRGQAKKKHTRSGRKRGI